jgi:uncharacterized protein
MEQITLIMIIIGLAGFVQGASGFGFGLVAIALLASVIDIKDASVLLVFSSLSINVFIFWHLRSYFRMNRVMPMIISAMGGVPLGVCLLVYADPLLLQRFLGVILLLTVGYGIIPRLANKPWHPLLAGLPCGLFSGAMSGAFATGGPPAVAFITSQRFDRLRYSATLQLVLGTCAIIRILCLGLGGMFTSSTLVLSLSSILCAVTGAWIGVHVLKKLSDRIIRRSVLVLLFVLALKYLSGFLTL